MRPHRGSALVAALIVIGVLALVTVATLRLANISKGQSAKDARALSQAACVDAARQYLIGRLRLLSKFPLTELDGLIRDCRDAKTLVGILWLKAMRD